MLKNKSLEHWLELADASKRYTDWFLTQSNHLDVEGDEKGLDEALSKSSRYSDLSYWIRLRIIKNFSKPSNSSSSVEPSA